MSSASSGVNPDNVISGEAVDAEKNADQDSNANMDTTPELLPELKSVLDEESKGDFEKKTDEGATSYQPSNTGWLFEDEEKKLNRKINLKNAILSVDIDSDEDSDYHLYDDFYDETFDDSDYNDYGSDMDLEDLLLMQEFGRRHKYFEDSSYDSFMGVPLSKHRDKKELPSEKELRKFRHSDKILAKFSADQLEGIFCDVVFVIEGQRFPAHKGIFRALGSYFEAMFSGKFSESSDNEITIGNVTKEIFQFVIDFAYGRDLSLSLDDVFQTFMVAEMFCMDDLVEECKRLLRASWKPSEMLDGDLLNSIEEFTKALTYADNMKMTEFSAEALKDIKREIEKKSNRKEILLMMTPNIIFPLISQSCNWDSTKETQKVEFLTEWLQKEPVERLGQLDQILQILKMELVESDVLDTFVNNVTQLLNDHSSAESKEDFATNMRKIKKTREEEMGVLKVVVKICTFSQNEHTLECDVRLYQENESGQGSWQYKTLKLDLFITESVEVNDQLVLFQRDTFFVVNLKTLDQKPIRKKCFELRRFSKYVANAHNRQIIVAGRRTRRGEDMGITVNALHYWKVKPVFVPLFNFSSFSYNLPMALSISPDTFYVLAKDFKQKDSSTAGALLVNQNRVINTYPFIGFQFGKLNEGTELCHRVLLRYIENEKIFLIDQYDSMFSGICITLDKSAQTKRIVRPIVTTQIVGELPVDETGNVTKEWIGSVKGNLLANCQISSAASGHSHLLLVAQGANLALFSIKSLQEFKFLRLLPKFDSTAVELDLPNTNFFMKIVS